ncbi:MAG: FAD-dependent oxidoreductase, partial [Actinobacteria bacterium]|nr:FAD-dependent oxidoreductase [Actinomycetota bacterium]
MNQRRPPGEPVRLESDVLIIGGGTAGCMAAVEVRERAPEASVLVLEKADVMRSGCLAAGLNAINLYLHPGETPESLVRYVRRDAAGLLREDLVLSLAGEVNECVRRVEGWGLPIKKDAAGAYEKRGRWNLAIRGELLKPILARAAIASGARIVNRVAVTNLALVDGRVAGAFGVGVRDGRFYVASAPVTIVATGGAAGIYPPTSGGAGVIQGEDHVPLA